MARKLRAQYPDAVYHVMNRGAPPSSDSGEASRREAIFLDDRDRELFLGSLGEEFRQELLAQASELAGPEHRGEDVRQSAEPKAERIVREELGKLGWVVPDLAGRPKGDARKVRIAERLRGRRR